MYAQEHDTSTTTEDQEDTKVRERAPEEVRGGGGEEDWNKTPNINPCDAPIHQTHTPGLAYLG